MHYVRIYRTQTFATGDNFRVSIKLAPIHFVHMYEVSKTSGKEVATYDASGS